MKAKTRAKLEKDKARSAGTYQDPIRLYERPIWFDVWFIVGLILTVPDLLVGVLTLVKADFSWELANASISGYFILNGYLSLVVQAVVFFALGSLLPVFIRRSSRRGKLEIPPARLEPGFYEDPIRKQSQRYWDGTAWTAELRAPFKREPGRMLFLCGAFFLISLLLGLGASVKALSTQTLKQSYAQSVGLAGQLAGTSPLTVEQLVDLAPQVAAADASLSKAVADFPAKEGEQTMVEEIRLHDYASYAAAFDQLADRLASAVQEIASCGSPDTACATAATRAASLALAAGARGLPVVTGSPGQA